MIVEEREGHCDYIDEGHYEGHERPFVAALVSCQPFCYIRILVQSF